MNILYALGLTLYALVRVDTVEHTFVIQEIFVNPMRCGDAIREQVMVKANRDFNYYCVQMDMELKQ